MRLGLVAIFAVNRDQFAEQGPSRYRCFPTIEAGGGVRWDLISMQALFLVS